MFDTLYNKEMSFKNNLLTRAIGIVLSLLVLFIFTTPYAGAATISLDPKTGSFGPGDMFVVTIRLDTNTNECVNVASVELLYPTDWIKATVVSKGESLLSLFTEDPRIDTEKGIISFAGGIPAGYCGRIQGDPGKSNVLAKVVFYIPGNMIGGKVATGPLPLTLSFGSSTSVLLNDGFGTVAHLDVEGSTLLREMASTQLKNEWLDIVHADGTPPDQFSATIEHDENIFDGRYFLLFTTVDKQSGIHHFEVREDDPERLDFVRGKNTHAEFEESKSLYYYELKDQELKSRITVRAVDNARNHSDFISAPLRGAYSRNEGVSATPEETQGSIRWIFGALVLILCLGFGYMIMMRKKRLPDESYRHGEQEHQHNSHENET